MESGQSPTKISYGQELKNVNPAVEIAKSVIEGKPPSNDIINKAIDSTKTALEEEIQSRPSTAPEVKLAKDAEAFLEVSKKLINEKNSNEQVQKFLLESVEALKEIVEQLKQNKQLEEVTEELSKEASEILESMKSVATQLVESVDFRSLLSDLVDILHDMVEERQEGVPAERLTTEYPSDITERGDLTIDEVKKQELLNSFKDVITRINASPDFRTAISGLFSIIGQLEWAAEEVKEEAEQQSQRNPHLRALWQDGREIISSFAGSEKVDKFVNDFWDLYLSLKKNYTVRKYFRDLKQLMLQVIEKPALLDDDPELKNELDRLYNEGRRWMNDPQFQSKLRNLTTDLRLIWDNIKDDELTKEFAQKTKELAQDLILDDSGRPNLGVSLTGMNQFRSLIAPILRKNLEYLPVPSFSGSNNTYYYEVEGLELNGREIIPDEIKMRVWGDADVSLHDSTTKALTYVTIWIHNIAVHSKDVCFYFHRKSFPQIDNRGIADLAISGDNFIKITWKIEVDQSTDTWLVSVKDINCHIDKMKIKIKRSTHSWLNKIISATLIGHLKRMVEQKVIETLHEGLSTVGLQLESALRSKE